jgi:hypothetical protein
MDSWATKMESVWLRFKNSLANLDLRIAELRVAQGHLDTKMAELADARDRLAGTRARTDHRFNALVDFVRAKRNRKPSP